MQDNGWDIYDPAAEEAVQERKTEEQGPTEPVMAEAAVARVPECVEEKSEAAQETGEAAAESDGDGALPAEEGKEAPAEFPAEEPKPAKAVPEEPAAVDEGVEETAPAGEMPQEPTEAAADSATPAQEPVAEEACGDSAPMNAGLAEQLAQLNLSLAQLDRKFDEKIKTSESQDIMAKTLYAEVQEYKKGMYSEILKPLLLELVQMRNNIIRQCRGIVEKEGSNARVSVQMLLDYGEDIRDVLEAYDVDIFSSEPGSEFDPKRQKLLKKVPVTREMMNKKVAASLCDGYRYKDRTIMKENVKVYAYEPEAKKEEEA